MKKLMIIVILIISNLGIAEADSGVFQPCSIYTNSIVQDIENDRLIVTCAGSRQEWKIMFIDYNSLEIMQSIQLDGKPRHVTPVNDGNSLLLLLTALDMDDRTEDGEIRQIACIDGHTEKSLLFPTRIPVDMTVDSMEDYAFVSCGWNVDSNPYLTKIDLSTFQKAGTDIPYNNRCESIEITNDDTKLYAVNDELTFDAGVEYIHIDVFDTGGSGGLVKINSIPLTVSIDMLIMGYDTRLFAALYAPWNGSAIYTIDTISDTILPMNTIPDNFATNWLSIDPVNHKLYSCSFALEMVDIDFEQYAYVPNGHVHQIDLDNNYAVQEFSFTGDKILFIEAMPLDDPLKEARIFGLQSLTNCIYYLDISR